MTNQEGRRAGGSDGRRPLPSPWPALSVAVLALLVIVVPTLGGQPFSRSIGPEMRSLSLNDPESRAEIVVARLDGTFFAEMAMDPSYGRLVESLDHDAPLAAYRASRPVTGWLAWILSLGGHRSLVAPALILITVVALGAAAYAISCLGHARGARRSVPLAMLALPGVIIALFAPGLCDPLAAAFGVSALAALDRGHRKSGILLLVLAVLSRETLLLLAVGIAVVDLMTDREWRALYIAGLPAAAYATWIIGLRGMVGAWPVGPGGDQLAIPPSGLLDAVPLWTSLEVLTVAVSGVLLTAAIVTPDRRIQGIAVVHLGFVLLLSEMVWKVWWGFGRVLLPVQLLGLVYLMIPTGDASSPPRSSLT